MLKMAKFKVVRIGDWWFGMRRLHNISMSSLTPVTLYLCKSGNEPLFAIK